MSQRGTRWSTTRASIILLSLALATGCAHRPSPTDIRVPRPPTSKPETSDSHEAARRADRKVRDVIKQLEKSGRRGETRDRADRPVSEVGTTLETSVSTTGTISPPPGWSSVVSTPMPGPTSGAATPLSTSSARTGNDQSAHRHIAAAIAFAIGLALAIALIPRWIGAR